MTITQRTRGQIEDWVIDALRDGTLEPCLVKWAQYWHFRLFGFYSANNK
jgi:hypothetical protein